MLRVQDLELFVNKLRYSTDNEASAILAQLRLGDTIEEILGVDMADGVSDMAEGEQLKEQYVSCARDDVVLLASLQLTL